MKTKIIANKDLWKTRGTECDVATDAYRVKMRSDVLFIKGKGGVQSMTDKTTKVTCIR